MSGDGLDLVVVLLVKADSEAGAAVVRVDFAGTLGEVWFMGGEVSRSR
ncbi:hypothetical protein QRX50_37280 [Amycolatopsis carbonis]|uniref:Uncharacterized protein n=1 Tax=Amycolatopsis carbonis TaxID=715471 RepID=A0A9Y2MSU0_9PSEU|nr:hypothetical protein [Amycolatopsis sp. 2-15]WIX77021.1 hypothetical protein QRX50_37280 [Amycolatopsis sp. 2-15]